MKFKIDNVTNTIARAEADRRLRERDQRVGRWLGGLILSTALTVAMVSCAEAAPAVPYEPSTHADWSNCRLIVSAGWAYTICW